MIDQIIHQDLSSPNPKKEKKRKIKKTKTKQKQFAGEDCPSWGSKDCKRE